MFSKMKSIADAEKDEDGSTSLSDVVELAMDMGKAELKSKVNAHTSRLCNPIFRITAWFSLLAALWLFFFGFIGIAPVIVMFCLAAFVAIAARA